MTQLLLQPFDGQVRQRVEVEERLARRTDLVRGNPIARERIAGTRIARDRVGVTAGRSAEVTIALRLCGHDGDTRSASILDVPLGVGEKMQLVPDDRPADGSAEVVALQVGFRLIR